MKKILLAIVTTFLFARSVTFTSAADSFYLEQKNLFLQTSLEKPVTETLIIKNLTDQKLTLFTNWQGYEKALNHSIDFAIVNPTTLNIEPFSIGNLDLQFSHPLTLKPGDYYGSLRVFDEKNSQVANFTLRLLGKLDESVEISNMLLSGDRLTFDIKNTGNITAKVAGNLTVTNFFGQVIMYNKIDQFDLKSFDSSQNSFVFNNHIPGPYQVKVETFFGSKDTNQTNIYSLWYFNYWVMIIMIGLVLTLISLIIYLKKRYAKAKLSH